MLEFSNRRKVLEGNEVESGVRRRRLEALILKIESAKDLKAGFGVTG